MAIQDGTMKIIAVSNHKGGCGKTTTAVNLAAALAERGNPVLLLDMDSQGHATLGMGVNPYEVEQSLYDLLVREQTGWEEVILRTRYPNLDLVPSNVLLSGAEGEITGWPERESVLRRRLERLPGGYAYCLIDCSPSLSLLTINALAAGTELLIPIQTQYYAVEGLKQLLETVQIIRQRFNPDLKILGLLLTFVESRTKLSHDIEQQMRNYFGELVFDTVIRKTVRLAEAPSMGEPIQVYAPDCTGAEDYRQLAEEIEYGKAKIRTAQADFVNI
ncbi:MAG: Sporulation initiation inhibitor protein Soj [Planctomycetes bacterium ADurb.Bin412]|nr:MAG: Sporulation initiation inhibitor protein Soj [Planctomycetes bacterium ADurb.Bin412]